jgi:hypothetical protein
VPVCPEVCAPKYVCTLAILSLVVRIICLGISNQIIARSIPIREQCCANQKKQDLANEKRDYLKQKTRTSIEQVLVWVEFVSKI